MRARLTRVLEILRDAVLEEWSVKLLSLLIAVGLWAWVQSGLLVDVRLKSDVLYVWPEGLARYEDVPSSISLTVQGPQAQVRRLERERPRITVDLTGAAEGPNTVDFGAAPIEGLPEGVHVVHVSPPSVDVRFERRYSRRVPVRVAVAGEVPAGYRLVSAKADPTAVDVSGPRSLVRSLADIPTEAIDLAELRETRTVNVPLSPSSRALTLGSSATVGVTVTLDAIIAERHFQEVNVVVDRAGWSASEEKLHVVLSGPVAELDRLDASKLKVRAHLPDPEPAGRVKLSAVGKRPGELEVVLPEDSNIKVKRLDPDSLQLERAP